MRVWVWSDYICPWCYLALDREDLLRQLGVDVTIRPFELHPTIPPEGRSHPPGSPIGQALRRIGEECRAAGLPFDPPARSPNSRLALATAEEVRLHHPQAFPKLHDALFTAHFAEGCDIGDLDVLEQIVTSAGADPAAVRHAVEEGAALAAVDESIEEARRLGVTATPAFAFVDHDLVVPGIQPRDTLTRWVTRLQGRPSPASGQPASLPGNQSPGSASG